MNKNPALFLAALTGPGKYAAAFTLGALTTLALPPAGAVFVLLVTVPGFAVLARASAGARGAFLTGWAFGAGYFIFGLYWISVALFVDIHAFWWALPLSALLGPAALALFYGLIPLAAWRYRTNDAAYPLLFAAAWALVEWLRGHVLTGFPWNLPGYAWHRVPPLLQANAGVGIYGLTLLTLLWAILPLLRRQRLIFGLTAASFALAALLGLIRLSLHPPDAAASPAAVRIVQANIPQSLKWNRDDLRSNFQRHLQLTALPWRLAQQPTFVVWPETAVIADPQWFPEIARDISLSLPGHAVALLGALRHPGGAEFYNSVIALSKRAFVTATYDKHHLVPFGEYIPFRGAINLTPVANAVAMIGDFTPGAGPATLDLSPLPRPSPLICYEAIFPGAVARRDDRPDWLLNVTNDAWYGRTAGPHQHFEIARVRAIEEGLPLVRAANTGISAAIDPLGRILGQQALGTAGVVDTPLPRPLPPTLYAKAGDLPFFLMLIVLAACGERLRRDQK